MLKSRWDSPNHLSYFLANDSKKIRALEEIEVV